MFNYLDKKLLKKIDTLFAKADLCLAEENEELREQTGNGLAEKTTTPSKQGDTKKTEAPQEALNNEILQSSLGDKSMMGKTRKWFYYLLVKNGFSPQWLKWLKRTTGSNG